MNTTKPKDGDRAPVIDAKGRRRGMKQFVVCPLCEIGRWVRDDSLKTSAFSGLCSTCHNKVKNQRMENHGRWKGGRTKANNNYTNIRVSQGDPLYCMAKNHGYCYEHRIVMARHIGRPLEPWELVHHKDNDHANNKIENLVLLTDRADHLTSVQVARLVSGLEDKISDLNMENMMLRKQARKRGKGANENKRD